MALGSQSSLPVDVELFARAVRGHRSTTTDGYGDALMAIRFAAEARRRVREIVLLCRRAEGRLLGRCRGIDRVATNAGGLPPVVAQVTVLGLAAAGSERVSGVLPHF